MARKAGKPAMLLESMSSRASQKRVFSLFDLRITYFLFY